MSNHTLEQPPFDLRRLIWIIIAIGLLIIIMDSCAEKSYPTIQGKAVSVTFTVVGSGVSTTLVCDSVNFKGNTVELFTNGLKQEILLGENVIANKSKLPHIR